MQTKENSEEGSKETENRSWGNFAEGPWWAVVSHLSMALRQADRELTQNLSSHRMENQFWSWLDEPKICTLVLTTPSKISHAEFRGVPGLFLRLAPWLAAQTPDKDRNSQSCTPFPLSEVIACFSLGFPSYSGDL